MDKKLTALREYVGEISDLLQVQSLLGWDQQVTMPPGGSQARGAQFATMAKLEHGMWSSPKLEKLLTAAEKTVSSFDFESDEAALVRVTRKQQQKRVRVTPEWVAEFARETAVATDIWVEARRNSNFSLFQPNLERIVDLRRAYAGFFAPYTHIYDPLLDDFEPGMKTSEVQAIFKTLRKEQVKLIKAIAAKPQVDTSFLNQDFPPAKQDAFGREVLKRMGYDFNMGRLDESAHPFTTTIGHGDVRITTRMDPRDFTTSLLGDMHEGGHALYDLGSPSSLARTPLEGGASMAIHESQSRMWENLVGLSLPFWQYQYPRLQKVFPKQLKAVSLDNFYNGLNIVQPSLIRVASDEATYNLHIMLRLELEIALMDGSLQVSQLPQAWNSRMQEYLGITPPDDAHGVLQDIHWSGGSFGYFPTYALGNLVSVQLWEKINQDLPDLSAQIAKGDLSGLLGWLRERVHRHGAKFEPQELMRRITGSPIDPQPYLRYLKVKFGAIYNL